MHKTKQQKAILALALVGIRHLQGNSKPTKKKVLDFIEIKKLYRVSDQDNKVVSTGEKAWRNRFAYLRFELHSEEYILFREHDCWELSESGYARFLKWSERVEELTKEQNWEDIIAAEKDENSEFFLTKEAVLLNLQLRKELK